MAKLVNALDLKSNGPNTLGGSSPPSCTIARSIPGFDKYMADRWGIVYSLKHNSFRILAQKEYKHDNYFTVNLSLGSRYRVRTMKVHKLIAFTFLGHIAGDGLVVHHKDGDGLNKIGRAAGRERV